ncbi:MFS transporter [Robbsia sp. Bb-Pol-6]|uniref:MFS transporter n=1 Tax=Robbsia betulipollinis TaxID=2981849 RepID=A0ABT3ZIF7_9BURK|nr:MFS transporter [Robbsia betulipollinis]MCY0386232.1 MFS transporter [Robbsia betulipollinis]
MNASASAQSSVFSPLLPFTIAVFLGFLAIGIPLAVLPAQVGRVLGFGTVAVGGAMGLQSLATLLTRQYAGRLCDSHGAKPVGLAGFAAAALAGVLYLLSALCAGRPGPSLAVLLAARLVLGLGESLFITALASWSIARVGAAHAGKAMAWQGMAMYGALAFGAPLGGWIAQRGGFTAVAACALLAPLLGAGLVARWPGVPAAGGQRVSAGRIIQAIWVPGLGLALASSGFGVIAAFLALRYSEAGWSNPGLGISCFGVGYLLMRVFFAGLPDRVGGFKVAMVSLLVEAAGLMLLAHAHSAGMALAACAVTAVGYSLIFPSLGVEAMKRVAAEHRGMVLGTYFACFDLGLALAGPLTGLVVQRFGLASAFVAGSGAALLSFSLIAVSRAARRRRS